MRVTFAGDQQVREHLALAAKNAFQSIQKQHAIKEDMEEVPPEEHAVYLSENGEWTVWKRQSEFHQAKTYAHLQAALMDPSASKFLEKPDEFLSGAKAAVELTNGPSTCMTKYKLAPLDIFRYGQDELRNRLRITRGDSNDATRIEAANLWMHALGALLLTNQGDDVPMRERLNVPSLYESAIKILQYVQNQLGIELRQTNNKVSLAQTFQQLWSWGGSNTEIHTP